MARTFTLQIETLKKYRASGEQTIKVQPATVNEGGQTVVGNISRGGAPQSAASAARTPCEAQREARGGGHPLVRQSAENW
jgi:hypothetical protein